MPQHSTVWVTIAIALPVIALVALLVLCLVLLHRRRRNRAQRLEDGTTWENGPLIMVSQTTIVHTDARWSMLRKPTFRIPIRWRSSHEAATPELPTRNVASARPSDSMSSHHECPTNDTNPDSSSRSHDSDTGSSGYHTPHSPPNSGHKESADECMSSSSHGIQRTTPRLAVRIPQWPAWLPHWPSPALSRKDSSSLGHSVSTHSNNDPYPHLTFQPPRVVRLEPSFLREYRPVNTHAHSDSTTSLIASAAPPGTSDATTSASVPPPAPAQPPPLTHARDDPPDVTPSALPNRIPSIPGSLRPGSRPSSLAPTLSVSSSAVARFPGFDGDSQPTTSGSESLSRTSTVASEFVENGGLPNPFASSASPWRAVLSAVGEAATGEENDVGLAVYSSGGGNRLITPGSPLPSLRSQRAFRAMPLHLEPTSAEERPASVAASAHGRTLSSATVRTLSSKPSYSASMAMTTSHSSYSPGGSALSART